MPGWTAEELDRVGDAVERQLAPRDGMLGNTVTIRVLRDGDQLDTRSR